MSDTNNKKSVTPVADWILEHVRPHAAWNPSQKDDDEDLKFGNLSDFWENAKDHIEIGIKFKFKF